MEEKVQWNSINKKQNGFKQSKNLTFRLTLPNQHTIIINMRYGIIFEVLPQRCSGVHTGLVLQRPGFETPTNRRAVPVCLFSVIGHSSVYVIWVRESREDCSCNDAGVGVSNQILLHLRHEEQHVGGHGVYRLLRGATRRESYYNKIQCKKIR